MRRAALAALFGLLLSGCGYDPAVRAARLQPLVGQPVTTLIAIMGVPTRTYETGGVQFLAYVEQRTDYLPGTPAFYGPGYGWPYNPYGFGGLPPQVVEYVCETTFQIVQERVASFSFRGNACY